MGRDVVEVEQEVETTDAGVELSLFDPHERLFRSLQSPLPGQQDVAGSDLLGPPELG